MGVGGWARGERSRQCHWRALRVASRCVVLLRLQGVAPPGAAPCSREAVAPAGAGRLWCWQLGAVLQGRPAGGWRARAEWDSRAVPVRLEACPALGSASPWHRRLQAAQGAVLPMPVAAPTHCEHAVLLEDPWPAPGSRLASLYDLRSGRCNAVALSPARAPRGLPAPQGPPVCAVFSARCQRGWECKCRAQGSGPHLQGAVLRAAIAQGTAGRCTCDRRGPALGGAAGHRCLQGRRSGSCCPLTPYLRCTTGRVRAQAVGSRAHRPPPLRRRMAAAPPR